MLYFLNQKSLILVHYSFFWISNKEQGFLIFEVYFAQCSMFADVILPLAVPNTYTYAIPEELDKQVKPGMRVEVAFGKKRLYAAIVRTLHNNTPKGYTPKYISSILDQTPIVNEKQFSHWEWIADYYMCTIGEVMQAALPAGFKLSSETTIIINPSFNFLSLLYFLLSFM